MALLTVALLAMALLTMALLTVVLLKWLHLLWLCLLWLSCYGSTCYRWALYNVHGLFRLFRLFRTGARVWLLQETEPDGSEGSDLLGHFGDELMRAARLVVDTGLHHLGWSRQQAIEYMEDHTYGVRDCEGV